MRAERSASDRMEALSAALRETPQEYVYRTETALRRSLKLLKSHLSIFQRLQFWLTKSFWVRSQSGRLFRIKSKESFNVQETVDGDYVNKYCVNFYGYSFERPPLYDLMLAQKLILESAEDRFMMVANHMKTY